MPIIQIEAVTVKDKKHMDSLLQDLKDGNITKVKELFKTNTLTKKFTIAQIKKLYGEDGGREKPMVKIRRKFFQHHQWREIHPLPCEVEECEKCSSENEGNETCLHPIQELFLWSLQSTFMEIAILLWEKCEDKIASACIAWAVKTAKSKEKLEENKYWQLQEEARQFQLLAISTLQKCHGVNSNLTTSLLTKLCPWWGKSSILQLAIDTQNKEFLAQPACKQFMNQIWKGELQAGDNMLADARTDLDFCCCLTCCPGCFKIPSVRFGVSLLFRVTFLILYSYIILFGITRRMSTSFVVLLIWVVDIAMEEMAESMTRNPVTNRGKCCSFCLYCKSYWKQKWNLLDVLTLILFALGMMVFSDNDVVHIIGRTALSIDFFFFGIRTLEMLMVFEDLGLMLVMVRKMIKDTINFMIILCIFVLTFAVSSEAILYSEREVNARHVYLILRKAYWQLFGELFLDEIEISNGCMLNSSNQYYEGEAPHCPSSYGRYIVPIMLGIYMMITNVLLLNLLIARFNKTFQEVHEKAVEYQSWNRSMIIIEFQSRPYLPPPLNIVRAAFGCVFIILCGACFVDSNTCKATCKAEVKPSQEENIFMNGQKAKDFENQNFAQGRDEAMDRFIIESEKQGNNKNSFLQLFKKMEELQSKMDELMTSLPK